MDWGEIGTNLLILLAILALLALNIFPKRRLKKMTPPEVALSLLSEVEHNQKLVDGFYFHLKVKKFKTGSWKRNKTKLDFLDQSLQTTLADAFSIAEGFNHDIDVARKHKSTSYLSGIDVHKLKEPLAKSKQGLEEWLQISAEKPQFPTHHSLSD